MSHKKYTCGKEDNDLPREFEIFNRKGKIENMSAPFRKHVSRYGTVKTLSLAGRLELQRKRDNT